MMWKVGDMCFFEFELVEITECKAGLIKEVTTGYLRTSTGGDFNDRCFSVCLNNKLVSDKYLLTSQELHEKGLPSLNFPDMHRWLVAHWAKTIKLASTQAEFHARYAELERFRDEILDPCERVMKQQTSYGFSLMR